MSDSTTQCPICKKPSAPPAAKSSDKKSPYPFCSDRCRLVDLNRWLEGDYQIPSDDDDLDESDVRDS
jgi:endogenous inhibitor of DNA gyrase (YacG/DUF329 family)